MEQPPEFRTLAEVVAAMHAQFARRLAETPEADVARAQERFTRFDLFPTFGWPLTRAGIGEAVERGDARVLFETLVKFLGLKGRAESRFGDDGLQPDSGLDYCALVPLAVHAAAVGEIGLVRSWFHASRPMSKQGHATMRNAANLLVSACAPEWPHRAKALAAADKHLAAKTPSRADRAYLGFFRTLAEDDADRRAEALREFAALYARSDFGRHKPWTQPVEIYGLACLAREFCPSFDREREAAPLFDATWTALWRDYEARRDEFDADACAFAGDLAFLRAVMR